MLVVENLGNVDPFDDTNFSPSVRLCLLVLNNLTFGDSSVNAPLVMVLSFWTWHLLFKDLNDLSLTCLDSQLVKTLPHQYLWVSRCENIYEESLRGGLREPLIVSF